MSESLRDKTINDFGEQWLAYQDNEGYYASLELFRDLFSPPLLLEEIKGAKAADIGSGTGRIVSMLLEAGAKSVIAVEPSAAFSVLKKNLEKDKERVTFLNVRGDELPPSGDLDYVFSVGVLHHIPDPLPAVKAAFEALKPGGKMAIWLYGKEGNRTYMLVTGILRLLTPRLPHALLETLARILDVPLRLYIRACYYLPLPMREYARNVLGRVDADVRRLVIYDQLNPAWAKYYAEQEALDLLRDGGFTEVVARHRHGYSWTVVGTKP